MKTLLTVIIAGLLLGLTPLHQANAQIPISTIHELQLIGQTEEYPIDGDYILTNDIDAYETRFWNDGLGFRPIEKAETWDCFSGNFDGNGYVIRGLYVNNPYSFGGLFRCITPGGASFRLINNLGIEDAQIHGLRASGILAGSAGNVYIENSWVTGIVTVESDPTFTLFNPAGNPSALAGGFIGICPVICQITDSFFIGEITSDQDKSGRGTMVGGLIGGSSMDALGPRMLRTYAVIINHNSKMSHMVGGITGLGTGIIEDSYAINFEGTNPPEEEI